MENNSRTHPPRKKFRIFDKDRPWLNAVLLAVTFFSVFFFGIQWSMGYVYFDVIEAGSAEFSLLDVFSDRRVFALSFWYAIVLISILSAHEMGHYLTARRYGINATLPFFIPFPTIIGTLGAYIRIRSPITRKEQLFDIGAAGPLSGFILALPALVYGVSRSMVISITPKEHILRFGDPLIVKILEFVFFKDIPAGYALVIHPVAFAGWVGILVTFLNLFPVGQLDGGHIAYSMLGKKAFILGPVFLVLFIFMGIFFWIGWFLWAALVLFLGMKHPRLYDENKRLSKNRRILSYILLTIFVLSFNPAPIAGFSLLDILL